MTRTSTTRGYRFRWRRWSSSQPAGTRRIFTEQAALSDGYNDLAGREEGTLAGLDNLDAELKREPGRA
jgi:hypothetical protein